MLAGKIICKPTQYVAQCGSYCVGFFVFTHMVRDAVRDSIAPLAMTSIPKSVGSDAPVQGVFCKGEVDVKFSASGCDV